MSWSKLTSSVKQPEVALNQLVQQGEVVRVCLVWHHPASGNDLQVSTSQQSVWYNNDSYSNDNYFNINQSGIEVFECV